jgi:hypothetical protein
MGGYARRPRVRLLRTSSLQQTAGRHEQAVDTHVDCRRRSHRRRGYPELPGTGADGGLMTADSALSVPATSA